MKSVFSVAFISYAGAIMIAPPGRRSQHPFPSIADELEYLTPSTIEDELSDRMIHSKSTKFKKRKTLEPFEYHLAASMKAAKNDPCNADLLAGGLGYPWGFGARAGLAADEVQLAAYYNKSVALCDGDLIQDGDSNGGADFMRTGINFQDYFHSSIGVCKDLNICFSRRTGAPFIGCDMSMAMKDVDYEFAAYLKRATYQALFSHFTAETQARVDAALLETGLQPGSEYVGLHVRRGDKDQEVADAGLRMNTTAEYAGVVLDELSSRGLNTVYLASDDKHAKHELLKILRASVPDVKIIQQFSAASKERSYAEDPVGTFEFLVDLAAMRDAAVFIGTQTSSAGRLFYFLRNEARDSISTNGGWLDNPAFI